VDESVMPPEIKSAEEQSALDGPAVRFALCERAIGTTHD
jgi:hypothetical protein